MRFRNIQDIREQLSTLDPQHMWEAVAGFHYQIKEAAEITLPAAETIQSDRIENIVFCGMGGSAIGGDLLKTYLLEDLRIPLIVNRHYTLPGFVDAHSLVIVSSYSGDTEETVQAYQEALNSRAQILGISSNGKVRDLLTREGFPLIKIPGGMQPRAALGYSFIPMVRMFHRLGLTARDVQSEIDETIDLITNLSRKYQEEETAYQCAVALIGTAPIIYTDPELAVVGTRWKTQLAENAQMLAFTNELPEMNHNEIMGWSGGQDFLKELSVIWLTDSHSHPRVQKRMEITGQLVGQYTKQMQHFSTEGTGLMSRLFSLIFLGDWVSLYAALLREINPTAIDQIELLKKRLNDS